MCPRLLDVAHCRQWRPRGRPQDDRNDKKTGHLREMTTFRFDNSGGASGHFWRKRQKVTIILRSFSRSGGEPCYNEAFGVISDPTDSEFLLIPEGHELGESLFLRN